MKKISLLIITLTTFASAQLRVGLDLNGGIDYSIMGIGVENKSKLGLRVGYEKTLFGIVGVGAEYVMTQLGDAEMTVSGNFFGEKISESETTSDKVFPNVLMGYGLARVPFGVPFARAIVRAGMFIPMGTTKIDGEGIKWSEQFEPELAWGIGVRAKLPLIPIGAELLYQSMKLTSKEGEPSEDDEDSTFMYEGNFSSFTLVATYSF